MRHRLLLLALLCGLAPPLAAQTPALDSARVELVRSRGFVRASDTQLSKTLDLFDHYLGNVTTAGIDSIRAELVRSRAFLRGSDTQLSKVLDLLSPVAAPDSLPPVETEPAPEPESAPPDSLSAEPPADTVAVPAPPPPPDSAVLGTALPELPRDSVDISPPPLSGRVIPVPAGGDLQAALDSAVAGDVVELQAGATWRGRFTLRAHPGDGAVVVRSSRAGELPAGARVSPADTARMARILGGYANASALTVTGDGWRLEGLEVALDPDSSRLPALVTSIVAQASGASGLVLDRVYVHSTPLQSVQRCVVLNGARAAIVHSWLSECHAVGTDAQAVEGWYGPGPYRIENNYLAGSGENIMFGGAAVGGGEIPSDIVIRGNWLHKPDAWRSKTPVDWSIKNLLEIKMARRLLIEDNVFDGSWADAQEGYAIIAKSENRDLPEHPEYATSDLTFRRNRIVNSRYGIAIDGTASTARVSGPTHTARVLIEDSEIDLDGEMGRGLILLAGVRDVTVRRLRTDGRVYLENGGHARLRITDSCLSRIMGSGLREGVTVLDARAPGWVFRGNVVTDLTPLWAQWYPRRGGNEYRTDGSSCLADAGS